MKFNFLILDYNRPKESELCLKSIKNFVKFDHSIIYLSNGGEQEYIYSYYKKGLIDKLILFFSPLITCLRKTKRN
jgi:GT2 family glycosyltransferase